jgi:hypothetical protein
METWHTFQNGIIFAAKPGWWCRAHSVQMEKTQFRAKDLAIDNAIKVALAAVQT